MMWHWHRYKNLPVTLHLKRDYHFHWTCIYGIQIGKWFFGAIQGHGVKEP